MRLRKGFASYDTKPEALYAIRFEIISKCASRKSTYLAKFSLREANAYFVVLR